MDVTSDTFRREVLERSHELPIVVDFWASWCAPCRMLGPAIEAAVGERSDRVELAKVDVDVESAVAGAYGIQSIPTVIVFRNGEPVTGFVGARPAAAIGAFLDDVLAQEGAAA